MAFKMKGAPMHDLSSKHGTNANYKKSGAPGLLGKILDPLGLKKKIMGGGKNCPPAQGAQPAAAPAPDAPAQPAAPAPAAAAPAAAPEEAAAAAPMKEGLKKGAPMTVDPKTKPRDIKARKKKVDPRTDPRHAHKLYKAEKKAARKKSPMEKGKTSTLDKLKAAGKAFIAGAKETHGGAKTAMDTYAMEKRKYRDAAEKNKNKKK